MARARSLVLGLVFACGGRTGLGLAPAERSKGVGHTIDAGSHDAPHDVAHDVEHDAPAVFACNVTSIVTLATNQSPQDIQIDDQYVYWQNNSPPAIRRVPKGGGPVEDVMPLPVLAGWGMTLDDAFVYGGGAGVFRAPKNGGAAVFLASANLAYGMAVDATTVYWTEVGGNVRASPKGGGSVVDLAIVPGGAMRVAIGGDGYVYYTGWTPPAVMGRVLATGGASIALADSDYSDYVTVDATHVYWDNHKGVWTMPKSGGTPTLLATGGDPQGLVVDDAFAYWADFAAVWKVPKSGGTEQPVAASQENARCVAVDATCVYWSLDPIVGEIRAGPK